MSALDRKALLAAVRRRADERRRAQPLERLKDLVAPDSWRRERFLQALHSASAPALIAVCQRSTPESAARIVDESRPGSRPARLPLVGPRWFAFVDACRAGGAAALGVVTERDHFGGSLEDLQTTAHARLPRLRLDFPLDEAMVLESCLAGADALRLVAQDLPENELRALRECCREYGLAVMIDVRDADELARALALGPEALCVPAREPELLRAIPQGTLRLVAGGIATRAEVESLARAGAQALLVGAALAAAEDPAGLLRALRGAV